MNFEAKLRYTFAVTEMPWLALYEPIWVSETRWLEPSFNG